MHKCKLSPEVGIQLYISVFIALSIISDVSLFQSAQKGITGLKKRQVSSRDAQIGEDIQFRARQDRFLLEVFLQ